jgi:hypothetical protein
VADGHLDLSAFPGSPAAGSLQRAKMLHHGFPPGTDLASGGAVAGSASVAAVKESMTKPVSGPDSPHELATVSLEASREALARLVESARQAQNLLSHPADVMASEAGELHKMALRHAREYLELSFPLAQGLRTRLAATRHGCSQRVRPGNGGDRCQAGR